MADRDDPWVPEFKPGWPEVFPTGIVVLRTFVRPGTPDEGDHEWIEEPDEVRFIVHAAHNRGLPRFGLVADLTVSNPGGFAGATVLMPLMRRHEDEFLSDEESDTLLLSYGEWGAALLYDVAAGALRSALAPAAIPLDVPFETPKPEIHTSTDDGDDVDDIDDGD